MLHYTLLSIHKWLHQLLQLMLHIILPVKVHYVLLIMTKQVSVGLLKLAKELQELQCGHWASTTNPNTFFNGDILPKTPPEAETIVNILLHEGQTLPSYSSTKTDKPESSLPRSPVCLFSTATDARSILKTC